MTINCCLPLTFSFPKFSCFSAYLDKDQDNDVDLDDVTLIISGGVQSAKDALNKSNQAMEAVDNSVFKLTKFLHVIKNIVKDDPEMLVCVDQAISFLKLFDIIIDEAKDLTNAVATINIPNSTEEISGSFAQAKNVNKKLQEAVNALNNLGLADIKIDSKKFADIDSALDKAEVKLKQISAINDLRNLANDATSPSPSPSPSPAIV